MNEIVMGKKKKVEDSIFVMEIEEGVSIIGKPDVAKNPMTGELERILYIRQENLLSDGNRYRIVHI